MTDREKLVALLTEWGVGFEGENAQRQRHSVGGSGEDNSVILCQGDAKIGGYSGFLAVFEFDDAGAFQQIGVWE